MSQDNLKEFEAHLEELISTPVGRRWFLGSMGLILASCATPDKTRFREGDNQGQATELTPADELKMTQEVLPKMKKDYPSLNNPEIQNYISNLGNKIIRTNNLVGNPYNYNFSVVGVGYVNAFALPAGTVFITAPLIAMADSEAELAGVVGHEIGHIKARHTAERMQAAKKAESKSWLYAIGGGVAGGALGYGLGKLICPPKDEVCLKKTTEMGLAAGAAGGMLVQKYAFMANSREDEMEADRIGFRTSFTSGFDKDHVGLFYEKLLKMEKSAKGKTTGPLAALGDALSTHPPSQERVTQMKQMSNEVKNPLNTTVSTKEFEKIKKYCVEWTQKAQEAAAKKQA